MLQLSSLALAEAQGPGILELFWQAGPFAKFIFFVLASMSVASWAIMISKALQYRKADRDGEDFLEVFRRSTRFSEVNAAAGRLTGTPMVGLFRAGYAEIDQQVKAAQERARAQGEEAQGQQFRVKSLQGVERSLRRAIGVEASVLSKGSSFLATMMPQTVPSKPMNGAAAAVVA
ncbi:MAG: hypothetical protein AAFY88_04045, partial [Acidobacteriota bacterium]